MVHNKQGILKTLFSINGTPNSIMLDQEQKNIYITDIAQHGLFKKSLEEKNSEMGQIVNSFEGEPLIGPN